MFFFFFLVFSWLFRLNRRLFRYFDSYSGISVIPVILVNRRTEVVRTTGVSLRVGLRLYEYGCICLEPQRIQLYLPLPSLFVKALFRMVAYFCHEIAR